MKPRIEKVKGGNWFIERFLPKGKDYRRYIHPETIRHAIGREMIERGKDHRVVIGCPVLDPETGRKTRVGRKFRKGKKKGYKVVCSASPVVLSIWHPDTAKERAKVKRIHGAMGRSKAEIPASLARSVASRERNIRRIESVLRGPKEVRKVAGMHGASESKGSKTPVALIVASLAAGAVALVGVIRSLAPKSPETGEKGTADLPTHYPFYPRVMPSYEVPDRVQRDAQIIEAQEVNAAGKVILSEEMQPIRAERYIPSFNKQDAGKRPRLSKNPYEFAGVDEVEGVDETDGVDEVGTDRPRQTYHPDEFEAVNATYENVSGLNAATKAPTTPSEMFGKKVMEPTIEEEGASVEAEKKLREFAADRDETVQEEDQEMVESEDRDEELDEECQDPEYQTVEDADIDKALDESEVTKPTKVPKVAVSSETPPVTRQLKPVTHPVRRGKPVSKRSIALAAELGEYGAGRIEDFEAFEERLMNGDL